MLDVARHRRVAHAARLALGGECPPRYTFSSEVGWREDFDHRVLQIMRPGLRVLDLGAGPWPTIPVSQRSPETHYVALDVSAVEMDKAAPEAYDETIVRDLCQVVPERRGTFDLVVSWLLFEHLPDVRSGMSAVRDYLAPGGTALIFLAGKHSPTARLNRLLPHQVSRSLLSRLNGRKPETVFPARYDRCSYSELTELAGGWTSFEVKPCFWAANYWRFAQPLFALSVLHEEWLVEHDRFDKAGYYLVDAQK